MTSKKRDVERNASTSTHATAGASDAPESLTKSSGDVAAQAADALAHIKQIVGSLPIDDAIPPNQQSAMRVTTRVSMEAMLVASRILSENPGHFPHFSATEAQAAIDYDQAIQPVVDAATVLATRLGKSVLKRRAAMAQQTLALYQVLKGTSRLAANEETRTQVKQLAKLLTTRRKSRATDVTQKEADAMVKTRKSAKKQAAAQAKADAASTEAAIASAQAALDAAIAEGTVPQIVTSPTPVPPLAMAPPVVAPSGPVAKAVTPVVAANAVGTA